MNVISKKLWLLIIAACAVGGIVFASSGAIARQLNDWDLLPKPEPYTLFYFNNPNQLPAKGAPESEQIIDATIHNVQHQRTEYAYIISVIPFGGEPTIVKTGECTLNHDQSCRIKRHFALPALAQRMQIKVDLTYQGRSYDQPQPATQQQSLHYWVDITPTRSSQR